MEIQRGFRCMRYGHEFTAVHTKDGELAERTYETIVKTGRSAPVIAGLARTRERLGLPPLPPIDMAEIQAILKPETAEEGRGPENELGKRS